MKPLRAGWPRAALAGGLLGAVALASVDYGRASAAQTTPPSAPAASGSVSGSSNSTAMPWDLAELMTLLGARTEAIAAFRETRESGLLASPLVIEGVLTFRAPDYLLKSVSRPHLRSFEVAGDRVTIDNGQRHPRQLRLGDVAPLEALVAAFRAVLAGDQRALLASYSVALGGERASWSLQLEPRDDLLATKIDRIVLSGSQAQLQRIVTHEVGGDRAVMLLRSITP